MAQMIIEIFAVPFFVFEKLCSSIQMSLYQTGEIVILANHFALVVNDERFKQQIVITENDLPAQLQAIIISLEVIGLKLSLSDRQCDCQFR